MFPELGNLGKNDWWRYLLGIFIVFMSYLFGQIIMYGIVILNSSSYNEGINALQTFEETMDFGVLGMPKNLVFILLISWFAFAIAGLYFVVKTLHAKDFIKMITPKSKVDYSKIMFGFLLWLMISLFLEAVNYNSDPENYSFRWDLSTFLPLVVISFIFLPIQTSFEELFFRGYLLQGFYWLSKNKWLPILISSILFGLVHGTNPEVAKYGFWTMQAYYILAGLFLAFITVMDDGLELALGVHAATNIFGATLFTYEGSVLQTDSLFITHQIDPSMMTFTFLIGALTFIVICKYKYNWPEWNFIFTRNNTLNNTNA
ncbi:MAG: CPBP family intramembrane metalloprotease [Saprospiraceae bacterium]|nr:CPBP family intramembrane metalloprotease [Saprospiraceae bacterium]